MLTTSTEHHSSKPYLRPSMASEYLNDLGISAATATLAKYRVTGEGPHFHKIGRQVVYSPTALAVWAEKRISPPKTSTSAA
jgi:hypothetical protein